MTSTKRFLVYRLHNRHSSRGFVSIGSNPTCKVVAAIQKATTGYQITGRLPGITYRLHEGDMVTAMIEAGTI